MDTPNLKRLRGRFLVRLFLWRSAETLLVLPLSLAAFIVLGVALDAAGLLRLPSMGGPVAAVCATLLVLGGLFIAAGLDLAARSRSRLLPWLDRRAGTRMLLTTAWNLAGRDGELSPVQQEVVDQAEALAGRPGRFAGLSVRGLGGRWWAMLPLAVAAASLAILLHTSTTPGGPDAPVAENPLELTRHTLVALAGDASSQGQSDVAGQLLRTAAALPASPADQADEVERQQRELSAELARAAPIIDAITDLSAGAGGSPFAAAVGNPGLQQSQAAAEARSLAEQWTALSAEERGGLADRLRHAAERIAEDNAALADRLRSLADRLEANDTAAVLRLLDAVVAEVHPMTRRRQVLAAALRGMDTLLERISVAAEAPAVAPRPAAGAEPSAPLAVDPADPRWSDAREHALADLQTRNLPPRSRDLVRRYFDAPAASGGN